LLAIAYINERLGVTGFGKVCGAFFVL